MLVSNQAIFIALSLARLLGHYPLVFLEQSTNSERDGILSLHYILQFELLYRVMIRFLISLLDIGISRTICYYKKGDLTRSLRSNQLFCTTYSQKISILSLFGGAKWCEESLNLLIEIIIFPKNLHLVTRVSVWSLLVP